MPHNRPSRAEGRPPAAQPCATAGPWAPQWAAAGTRARALGHGRTSVLRLTALAPRLHSCSSRHRKQSQCSHAQPHPGNGSVEVRGERAFGHLVAAACHRAYQRLHKRRRACSRLLAGRANQGRAAVVHTSRRLPRTHPRTGCPAGGIQSSNITVHEGAATGGRPGGLPAGARSWGLGLDLRWRCGGLLSRLETAFEGAVA